MQPGGLKPSLVLIATIGALLAIASAGTRTAPPLPVTAATLVAGCGAHDSYVTPCALGPGSVDDSLTAPRYVNYYRLSDAPAGQIVRVELRNSSGLQVALIRDATGVAGPVDGGLANARPQYAVDEFGPAIPNDGASGGSPQTSIGPSPAPFFDIPFFDIPFFDIPFFDIPFFDIPFEASAAEHASFRPIQLVALGDGSADTQVLTHVSDAIDASDLVKSSLVLAVWSATGAETLYTVGVSYPALANACAPGVGSLPPVPDGFAPAGSAAPPVPDGVTTLVLTNESQWARQYGGDGQQTVMAQLGQLTASPLVNGVVLSLDADPAVAAAYAAWDQDQCSATRANAVAATIKRLVKRFLAAHPSIQYLVIAGDDAVVPYFRVPDDARIANEAAYAGQTGLNTNSADAAAFLRRNILTDDYYADPRGTVSGARLLYSSQLPIGRLVESPGDVTAAVQTFLSRNGVLSAASGFATGYDFLRDTADAVAGVFAGRLTPLTLIDDNGWNASSVDAGLSAATDGPDVVFFSGHFAHGAMQTATLDGYRASSITTKANLQGKLLFSVGCHSGASIVDASADPSTGIDTFDWAQAVAQLGGVLVANTGYGYGNSDAPAYGQELMLDFARSLAAAGSDQPLPIGQALMAAKQLYRARNDGKWDGYHSKTVMESTLYGLPMYRIALSGMPRAAAAVPDVPSTPAASALRYDGPSQQHPGQYVLHLEVDAPQLQRHDASSGRGSYFSTDDGIDVRAFQPVQPQLTFKLPFMFGFQAHGALVTGATYTDSSNFDPIVMRPMWDQTEYEPQFDFADLTPYNPALVNAVTLADGTVEQNLVLTLGQFQSTGEAPAGDPKDPQNPYVSGGVAYPHSIGRERLFQHLSIDVYYSTSGDWRPPRLRSGGANCSGQGSANLTATLAGADAGTRVVALTASDGQESRTGLAGGASQWSGAVRLGSGDTGMLVGAVDAAGNVALLPMRLGSDVAGGCAGPNQPAQPGQPAQSGQPTPMPGTNAGAKPRGNVYINGFGMPTLGVGGVVAVPVRGTWDSGPQPCNLPGAQWTIVLSSTAAGPASKLPAPCGGDGRPMPWSTVLTLPPVSGLVTVCAGVGSSSAVTPTSADATDCQSVTAPIQPSAQPPAPMPSAAPPPACVPSPGQRC